MADSANIPMLNPYEANKALASKQVEFKGIQDTIRQASEEMVAASTGDTFLPGTGGETAASLLARRQGELQAQGITQRVNAATNTEAMLVSLGQDLQKFTQQRQQLDQKIATDSAVSLWDDPLTALANAFTLPWDEQARDAVDKQVKDTENGIANINSSMQQAAKTADAISIKVTDASLASVATAAEKLQSLTAANARLQAAKSQGDALKEAINMDVQRTHLYVQQKQLEHSDAQEKRAQAQYERQMQILGMQMEEHAAKKTLDKFQLEMANKALIADGKNPMDEVRLANLKGLDATMAQALIAQGMAITAAGDMNTPQGMTIDARMKYWETTRWKPTTPQQQKVVEWQMQATKQAAESSTNKNMIGVNKEELFKNRFLDEQRSITEGSPFEAPAYTVIGSAPEIRNSAVWQKYVVPQLDPATVKQAVRPEVILSAVEAAMKDKVIDSSQASAFVSHVFGKAVMLNNTAQQFKKITGREQTEYSVNLELGTGVVNTLSMGAFGGRERINLTDPVKVQYALQQRYLMRTRQNVNLFGTAMRANDVFSAAVESGSDALEKSGMMPPAVPFPNLPAQFQGVQTYEDRTGKPFYSTVGANK